MMARPRVRHGAWYSTFHALASVSTFCSEAVPLQVGYIHTSSQQSGASKVATEGAHNRQGEACSPQREHLAAPQRVA